jgi:DNA replication and repair protein RecF
LFFQFRSNFILVLLRNISLFQFRNYREANFSFEKPITCICGKNGSGKTNLLDAIYTLCYTKSYFSATIGPTVMNGQDSFRISGDFYNEDQKRTQVVCKYQTGKKEFSCAGRVYDTLSEHIGKYAAVMIAPDDIELINDGSELRRKFMDGILSQCYPEYFDALLSYQKALQQRNAWLKQLAKSASTATDLLAYFDEILDRSAGILFAYRKKWIQNFAPLLQEFYERLSGGKETVTLNYETELGKEPLRLILERHLDDDMRYQRTLRGAHRDDLGFRLDGLSLRNFGSQGQKKSFLFALKLAQYVFLKEQMNQDPILLLDDVFEKLDQTRMEALLEIIQEQQFAQVILTDTHDERIRATLKITENDYSILNLNLRS